jgi:hypothetical protein
LRLAVRMDGLLTATVAATGRVAWVVAVDLPAVAKSLTRE